jgi:flavorubredoxin
MITEPFPLTADSYLIPSFWQAPGAPVGVNLSSAVLLAAEPVLLDTGAAIDRGGWTEAVRSVVDPADVRWIVLPHDDPDHTGNLPAALELCPGATVVSTWFMSERMGPELPIDPRRLRWVGHEGTLDVGDRTLRLLRPPLYDSPTTRVVHDPVGGLLWAADLFATPTLEPTNDAADMDPAFLKDGFLQFQRLNSPWYELLDRSRYQAEVDKLAALRPSAIASTHGPAFLGAMVDTAFDLLREVTEGPMPDEPGQETLDQIVASLLMAAPGA